MSTTPSLRLVLPASNLESSSLLPSSVTQGVEGLQASPGVIAFGALRPGASSSVEIEVTNIGISPLRLSLETAGLTEPVTGAMIGSDRITVELPADSVGPGEVAKLLVTLKAPYGSQSWLPAGTYSGKFALDGLVLS